jgi:hypothetical protein
MYASLLIMLLIVMLLAESDLEDCNALWEVTRTKNETWSNRVRGCLCEYTNFWLFSSSIVLCILDASSSVGGF